MINSKFFILLLLHYTIYQSNCNSQPPNIEWEKTFGGSGNEEFRSICLRDSNILLMGSTSSDSGYIVNNHGGLDSWIVNIDLHGNLNWNRCYGGISSERGFSIATTFDKGFITLSEANFNNGDVSGVHWIDDFWIIKIDSIGLIKWKNCYGGTGGEYAGSIIQTLDSNFLVVGESSSNNYDVPGNYGSYDFWVCKIDTLGSIIWSKNFGGSDIDGAFGNTSCIQNIDGTFYVVASSFSNNFDVSGNHGGNDIWVIKLDSIGGLIWQRCYGGSALENGFAIAAAENCGFYITGVSVSNDGDVTSSIGNGDIWLFKADSTGTILWDKCFGGLSIEQANTLYHTNDGGLVLAGLCFADDGQVSGSHGNKDFWVVKIDSIGNFEWGKAMGGTQDDEAESIIQVSDGGFIVAGSTASSDGDISNYLGGTTDAWVVKLSPQGSAIKDLEYSIMDLAIYQMRGMVHVRFFSRINDKVVLSIIGVNGKVVSSEEFQIHEGINWADIPINLISGSYCISVAGNLFQTNKKFVIPK